MSNLCQLIFEIHKLKKYISVGQVLLLGPFKGYQLTNYHNTVDPSTAGQNTVDQVQVTPTKIRVAPHWKNLS